MSIDQAARAHMFLTPPVSAHTVNSKEHSFQESQISSSLASSRQDSYQFKTGNNGTKSTILYEGLKILDSERKQERFIIVPNPNE